VGDLKDVEGTLHGAYVKSPRAIGTLASLDVRLCSSIVWFYS
jgi:hypothetical protein